MIECDPAASVLVVKVAIPSALSVPVPSGVVPSRNVTVPVRRRDAGRAAHDGREGDRLARD